ncbi:hypothetical protein AMRN_1414 [Malaciobacter marinus]|uniref:Uncharacterized protein n=1 Tax=Malaciobacter marinus TaxID=505249 RepID=A0A347TKM2_9BACT|nr:hypothetical protein [Malaciobacter marinus]AXX87150.1 hypothetical protein AMRN_1414 [Malaciobacter marinus]PHO14813.1 hypothetical protein CPH92_09510 [Malaciobacter marinus]
MFKSRWTTINEDGEIETLEAKDPTYNPNLELYTDYKFTNSQKFDYWENALKDEASNTFLQIDSVFTNAGNGIKNASKAFKYLPLIAIGAAALFAYKKVA